MPLDLTESFRPGTGEAPARIRAVAESLEDYSPALDVDLADVAIVEVGDVPLGGLSIEAAIRVIQSTAEPLFRQGFVLAYGGEHTGTLGLTRAARKVHPDIVVLQLDAHTDTRDEYDGQLLTHATWLRPVGEELGFDSVIQLGIRSGTRAEFQLARSCLHASSDLNLSAAAQAVLHERPVYVTIDIDVLDPSVAPGTGCPEPGGASFNDLARFLYSIRGCRVIGADVMEVLPTCDVADVTSITAAKLGREMLCMWAR